MTWMGIAAVAAMAIAVAGWWQLRQRNATLALLQQQDKLLTQALAATGLSASHFDLRTGTLTRSSPEGLVSTTIPLGPEDVFERLFKPVPEAERQRLVAYLHEVIADGSTEYHFEFSYVAPDGTQTRMAVTGRIQRDERGDPVAFAGVEENVTKRRRLEERIQNAQRLESLGMLAGGVAHDFNNLVLGIMGGAAQLESLIDHSPEARRALALIDRGATRAAELTQQLLAYAGRGRSERGPVDLCALVADLVPLLETSLERRAAIALDVAPAVPAVLGEATQLRQVLMNLVLNAAEAMGPGGTVTIRLSHRYCDRAYLGAAWHANDVPAGDYVTLEVRDTGAGMTAETRQRIFDPFFTTKFTGRGLGLAAVLGIVQRHDGAIVVETALGHGTSFTVLLPPATASRASAPRAEGAANAVPSQPASRSEGSTLGAVLIVDDEPVARDVAAQMLEAAQFTTETAAGGEEALRRIRTTPQRFAAVLLDLTMPGRSGLETLREIRELDRTLPVVLMSGYSARDAGEALADGTPTVFLPKPFRSAALLDALRSVLGPARP